MSWLLVVFVLILLCFSIGAFIRNRSSDPGTIGFPYEPAKKLFTAAERSFLGVLDQALGPEYRVFGKIRVADIATVKPGLAAGPRQGALNRIASKHLDFVVCRSTDLVVLCAIELNDKSHLGRRAQARDDFLANVCRTIGLPLLQVVAKQSYSPGELRERVLSAVVQLSPPQSPIDNSSGETE